MGKIYIQQKDRSYDIKDENGKLLDHLMVSSSGEIIASGETYFITKIQGNYDVYGLTGQFLVVVKSFTSSQLDEIVSTDKNSFEILVGRWIEKYNDRGSLIGNRLAK